MSRQEIPGPNQGVALQLRGTAKGPTENETLTGFDGNSLNVVTVTKQVRCLNFNDGFGIVLSDDGITADINVGQIQVAAADGAISIKSGVVLITKAGVCALTLAAPVDVEDDGKQLLILSKNASAHTVTQTDPGFDGAGGGGDVATFGAASGNFLRLVAYNGKWYSADKLNVTIA